MARSVIALLVIGALLCSACAVTVEGPSGSVKGSGHLSKEAREVSGFTSLILSGVGEVVISQGATESLTVEAEDNIMPQIKTEVAGGALSIGFVRDRWQDVIIPTKSIKFDLTVKDLRSIESTGAANIRADALKTSALTVKLSGAGSVKLSGLEAGSLTVTLSGAGSLDVKGAASQQAVTLSGVGSYRAGDLRSQTAKVTVSGAGSATMWVTETLNATISGVGSINYYGTPQVSKTVTGVGSVKSLGGKE